MYTYFSSSGPTTEWCYYIQSNTVPNKDLLQDIIGQLTDSSVLENSPTTTIYEIGPQLTFRTSWCSNALSIFHKCGLSNITRIERSRRIQLAADEAPPFYDPMLETFYSKPLNSFDSPVQPEPTYRVPIIELQQFNEDHGLGWDDSDIAFYSECFDREPTNVELLDLAQCNSEHSRHLFFSGTHVIDGMLKTQSLFQMIKNTLPIGTNSVSAFCDNASAITGGQVLELTPQESTTASKYQQQSKVYHPTFTAETHNFPTGIAPFPGAATGVGGRIRDTLAIGRGGKMVAGTAGYCIADRKLLIEASNGASDYGNKVGEPIIQGFTRFFDGHVNKEHWAWIKPIMFSGGVGMVREDAVHKNPATPGLAIVRLGGPGYRIGLGGSTASSQSQSDNPKHLHAVQRGDPEMGNRVVTVIRALIESEQNPIISIHDQGAGGAANVTKEIVYPVGGRVDISKLPVGDPTMTTLEKWIAEYQEQVTLLVDLNACSKLKQLADRENVEMVVFGETTDDGHLTVVDPGEKIPEPVHLNLSKVTIDRNKLYTDETKLMPNSDQEIAITESFDTLLLKLLQLDSVGSKRFLTNKVDRSVSGLIAQQQCVGPYHTPIADFALVAHSHFGLTGTATSIGEQPLKAFGSPYKAGQLAVIEMLLNLVWVKISALQDIKCSVNWMWPAKLSGENAAIYQTMEGVSEMMTELGISADGGKDSVSMYTKTSEGIVKSPRSVVVSGYVTVPDITKKVTPELKPVNSYLFHIPVDGCFFVSLAGSAFMQLLGTLSNGSNHIPSASSVKKLFNLLQSFLVKNLIIAGHDISDGGLVTTLVEMAIAGGVGFQIVTKSDCLRPDFFVSETPGVVIQVPQDKVTLVEYELKINEQDYLILGKITGSEVSIVHNDTVLINQNVNLLRGWWELNSRYYEESQSDYQHATDEWVHLTTGKFTRWIAMLPPLKESSIGHEPSSPIRVAVLRDEGSNGAREMAAAFFEAGFEVWDITMNDLIKSPQLLNQMRGVAFVGGFTYADVFGAARGWAAQIKHNQNLRMVFDQFKNRNNTFSFGVCNGCQLMSQIGWIPECQFVANTSGKFESRLSTVRVETQQCLFLKDLDLTTFGIWVAHAEGRFIGNVPNECQVLKYVDDNYRPTEAYPLNPSGSQAGVCGVCSLDGRHLAMMPHPERCWLSWQMPWLPEWWEDQYTPWFQIFQNAYNWCKSES
jgi:phosphoribosylformylglycinamidine synthase